ncbi:hypothetical protein [Massilia sp. DD77]|uniref:hypothetical protein n=1 Tax=Massilia sp. DD77 TaxID=3109349 RepID=UPI002FFEB16F
MKKRRIRRTSAGADYAAMTPEDREAIRTYRANRGSSRYYSDLKAIDTAPQPTKPEKPDDSKT